MMTRNMTFFNTCQGCRYYYCEDYELVTSCHYDESDSTGPMPCEYYDNSYELQHDKQEGEP